MPIVVEALPPAKFAAWVKAQGGTMPGADKPAPAAAAPAGAATPIDTFAAPVAAPTK